MKRALPSPKSILLLAASGMLALATGNAGASSPDVAGALADWPRVESRFARDPAMEARIAEIVRGMTLAQKIGQMTQPEIKSITPDEVRQYYIGSVLNGGGSWPDKNMRASVKDWLDLARAYHAASMASDMKAPVPVIWGTDAVHGHNNIFGATLFPHNIGLGAARDPDLIGAIAASVGRSVRATGIDWTFAPTLAVVQDQRWGRAYEGFSADPQLVRSYGARYVQGLQGDFSGDGHVVATAKHFIGDGGTANGTNEGVNQSSSADMINIHGAGYYGALAEGVQTVMASFNSWNDVGAGRNFGKVHGSRALLTGVLKDKMGFDGFVISDWNGIGQIPGCTNAHCPQAINAGVDMVMVPDDWKAFIANMIRDVETGAIPMARIDDAVTRILRVKLRARLFDRSPASGRHAGDAAAIQDRALARRAVRESLVLLKNERNALPLAPGKKILVVGRGADNMPMQVGGWSLTWQGDKIANADFPNGQTILAGIRAAAGAANIVYSATGKGVDPTQFDAVIAVIGEEPYAETAGDIIATSSLHHAARYPKDLEVLKRVAGKKVAVVTVLLSGRLLYANDLLNLSDAFVAAWLPGTEGGGIADLLIHSGAEQGEQDFRGRLPFAWPGAPCAGSDPLFPLGYGLRYATPKATPTLSVTGAPKGCAGDKAGR